MANARKWWALLAALGLLLIALVWGCVRSAVTGDVVPPAKKIAPGVLLYAVEVNGSGEVLRTRSRIERAVCHERRVGDFDQCRGVVIYVASCSPHWRIPFLVEPEIRAVCSVTPDLTARGVDAHDLLSASDLIRESRGGMDGGGSGGGGGNAQEAEWMATPGDPARLRRALLGMEGLVLRQLAGERLPEWGAWEDRPHRRAVSPSSPGRARPESEASPSGG